MERESFEDEATAEMLNQHFVPVKVDREERPDVDKIYMTYVQATQGGGGWPMSVFLTPELAPFFGGTYFPPEDAYNRPGFKSVLRRISDVWGERKSEIKESSTDAMRQLAEIVMNSSSNGSSSESGGVDAAAAISACAKALATRFDGTRGGFGSAPKFPRPSELALMMVQYVRLIGSSSGSEDAARRALHMATFSLDKMAAGGIHDHLGNDIILSVLRERYFMKLSSPRFSYFLLLLLLLLQAVVSIGTLSMSTGMCLTLK